MTQYLNKDDLVEWLINLKIEYEYDWNFAIDNVLKHINDLEMKKVDLDFIKDELDELIKRQKPNGEFGWGTLYNVATYFFELGLKVAQNNN